MANPIAETRNQDDARFGMHPDQLNAAMASSAVAAAKGIVRMGMYVPTRFEVRTWPALPLSYMLDLWLYDCPSEIIPSDNQVREIIFELERRPDKDEQIILNIVEFLNEYIHPKADAEFLPDGHSTEEIDAAFDALFKKLRGHSK